MTTTANTVIGAGTHRLWCTNHQYGVNGDQIVEWGFCKTQTTEVAGLLVDVNDGSLSGEPQICVDVEELTAHQARAFASLLVTLAEKREAHEQG